MRAGDLFNMRLYGEIWTEEDLLIFRGRYDRALDMSGNKDMDIMESLTTMTGIRPADKLALIELQDL